MRSVLTVCVGNICRSPMAQALLAAKLPDMEVSSAGIGALVGQRADPMAVQLMNELGLDISNHIARQISAQMCLRANVILVMDSEQRRYIESFYPSVRGKVFRVAEFLKKDVPDPYRKDRSEFEYSLSLLDEGVRQWAERISKI